MRAEVPEVKATARYSISQVCQLLEIHRNTLYNYTQQGLIKCGMRRASLRKYYLGSEVLKLWRASI
jgi:DNA-binding transcriptional MerR regulator